MRENKAALMLQRLQEDTEAERMKQKVDLLTAITLAALALNERVRVQCILGHDSSILCSPSSERNANPTHIVML